LSEKERTTTQSLRQASVRDRRVTMTSMSLTGSGGLERTEKGQVWRTGAGKINHQVVPVFPIVAQQ
jgi:hypothetical protein